jgi:hypothetical protein
MKYRKEMQKRSDRQVYADGTIGLKLDLRERFMRLSTAVSGSLSR